MLQDYIKLNANEFAEQKAFWEAQLSQGSLATPFKLFAPSGKNQFVQVERNFSSTFEKFDKEIQSNSNSLFVVLVAAMGIVHRNYGQTPINFHLNLKKSIEKKNTRPLPLVLGDFFEHSLDQLKSVQEKINQSFAFQDFPFQLLCDENKASKALDSNILIGDYEVANYDYDLYIIVDFSKQKQVVKAALRHGVGNQSWLEDYLNHLNKAILLLADDNASIADLQLCEALPIDFGLNQIKRKKLKNIISQFENIAGQFPDRLAVKTENVNLSYAELNLRANRIAGEVRERWIGSPNFIVGLFLEKNSWSIACMLGVLKAGGAYLPMDIDTPINKLEHIVENSGLCGVITMSDQMFNLQEINIESLYIDIEYDGFSARDNNPSQRIDENQIAYVIYTSGSTGNAKGVKIGHRNIINTLQWRQDFYQFNENHACLQLASHAFDSSVEDIYGMLLSGGTIVIPAQEKKADADYLIELLITHKVSHLLIVPSLYRIILDNLQLELPHLEAVTVAGEAMDEGLVRRHFDWLTKVRLINEYGPTECSVCATFKELEPENPVTIGSPITNTQVAVVNSELKLLPPGIHGELLLGGPGVSLGYINDPKLNSQKFIEDNIFKSGTKLYKTGDLVRWNLDGELEFLGRIDNQVKIRGIRVEPSEISRSLNEYPGIDQAAVVARLTEREEYELVAFYTADRTWSDQELREFMADHVMIALLPSQFIHLDSLPLNTNGKVDFQKLSLMEIDNRSGGKYVQAETVLQSELVEIWEEILNQNEIGIDDDFFELGGHSLKATTFISEARKRMGLSLTINEIFEYRTIRSLGKFIEDKNTNLRYNEIDHLSNQNSYCLSSGQLRLLIMLMEEGNQANYRMDCLYSLEGPLKEKAFEKSVQGIFKRHDSLRTKFVGTIEEPRQQFTSYNVDEVPFTYESFEHISKKEAIEKINSEKNTPFDFLQSDLVKFRLVKINPTCHLFLLSVHHIISDGWSIGILIRELMNGYNHRVNDLFYEPDTVSINYGDYSEWLCNQLEKGNFSKQKKYWGKQLNDIKEIAELPLDHSRPKRKNYQAGNVYFNIDTAHFHSVRSFEKKEGLSTFMIMLASLGLLISYHSSKTLFTLGAPFTGRTLPELKDLIGILINTLALRVEVKPELTVSAYMQGIKKTVLEGIEYQLYPYEQILQDLEIPRDSNKTPLFEVGLTWQNHDNISDQLSLAGLSVEQIITETPLAQHDLWFYGTELNNMFSFEVVYSKELFNLETIKDFIADFKRIATLLSTASSQKVQYIFEQLRGTDSQKVGMDTFMNLHEDF